MNNIKKIRLLTFAVIVCGLYAPALNAMKKENIFEKYARLRREKLEKESPLERAERARINKKILKYENKLAKLRGDLESLDNKKPVELQPSVQVLRRDKRAPSRPVPELYMRANNYVKACEQKDEGARVDALAKIKMAVEKGVKLDVTSPMNGLRPVDLVSKKYMGFRYKPEAYEYLKKEMEKKGLKVLPIYDMVKI